MVKKIIALDNLGELSGINHIEVYNFGGAHEKNSGKMKGYFNVPFRNLYRMALVRSVCGEFLRVRFNNEKQGIIIKIDKF